MSTKVSITYCVDEASGTKAHLYDECFLEDAHPIYLELSGVKEFTVGVGEWGTTVNVAIPRVLASKLGLLPRPPEKTGE
jgi:hypothetical protein